jgi:glycosyltransferase involved in cell wall biosynthesis
VFTATYQRAYCLSNCYESLKRQTCKDFLWLIIDDGSTDETSALVGKWISENAIEIRYHWQPNGGMHAAHNAAYELIDTELNVCIDSDDFLADDAVERILNFWRDNASPEISGIVGLDAYTDGQIVGTRLPTGLRTARLFDLYQKYRVTGDKKIVYRTELIRLHPYPIFPNEKYVGLASKYYQLDQYYQLLLLDEVLCIITYMPDGSTRNKIAEYRRNPRGFAFYRKTLMNLPFASLSYRFRQAIHYVSSSAFARNRQFLHESPRKLETLLAIPAGLVLCLYILAKTRFSRARESGNSPKS